jgi:uncharacterized protein (DUF2267 family)
MRYRDMINMVQQISGSSDEESTDALQFMVESVAVHLNEGERKDFASQLPVELGDIALTVLPTADNIRDDIIEQYMELEEVDEPSAITQIKAAWNTLKEAISGGEIEDIKSQLPNQLVGMLG